MRKLLMALIAMFFMAGLVIAAEVIVVSYDKDKKELKVKEGDAEKVYKVTDKTKFTITDKDGNAKEAKYENFEKRVTSKFAASGKMKIDIKTDKENITEAKWKGVKGKK
ncbi:MAG: hypothetical protein L0241_29515 [Planctomycetia bacterium]|nr:hypothetical protein [Planctomycetia bacterium]